MCGWDVSPTCKYDINIIIHDLNDPSKSLETGKMEVGSIVNPIEAVSFRYLESKASYVAPTDCGVTSNDIVLPAGSYLIEKIIYPAETNNDEIVNDALNKIKKICRANSLKI